MSLHCCNQIKLDFIAVCEQALREECIFSLFFFVIKSDIIAYEDIKRNTKILCGTLIVALCENTQQKQYNERTLQAV